MRLKFKFSLAIIIIFLIFYSNSSFLSKNTRELQNELTSSSTDIKSPFQTIIADLTFYLTQDGKPKFQILLDGYFAQADKNSNSQIDKDEFKKQLIILSEQFFFPSDIDTQPIFEYVMKQIQKDDNKDLNRAEFDLAFRYGVEFILPYYIKLTGTPYERNINAKVYSLEIKKSLAQKKYDSKNDFENLWKLASQGYSSINDQVAIEFISQVCFRMGYAESNSNVIKKIVNDHSKNNSLIREDFETAFREAYDETYNYLEDKLIPSIDKEVESFKANNMNNVVSLYLLI